MARRRKNNRRIEQDGINYKSFNNKVVEAKLSGDSTTYSFESYLASIVTDTEFVTSICSPKVLMDSYVGRAFCNTDNGEVFDLEVGKKIALDRCLELYHGELDKRIVAFLEELHTIEARLFNRLRQSGKLDLYAKAKTVDEIYDTSFRMPYQTSFIDVYVEACPEIFCFNPCDDKTCDNCKDNIGNWIEK